MPAYWRASWGLKGLPRSSNTLTALKRDEVGVTAIEYGLIAVLVAMAVLTAVASLDDKLGAVFSGLAGFFATAGR